MALLLFTALLQQNEPQGSGFRSRLLIECEDCQAQSGYRTPHVVSFWWNVSVSVESEESGPNHGTTLLLRSEPVQSGDTPCGSRAAGFLPSAWRMLYLLARMLVSVDGGDGLSSIISDLEFTFWPCKSMSARSSNTSADSFLCFQKFYSVYTRWGHGSCVTKLAAECRDG